MDGENEGKTGTGTGTANKSKTGTGTAKGIETTVGVSDFLYRKGIESWIGYNLCMAKTKYQVAFEVISSLNCHLRV